MISADVELTCGSRKAVVVCPRISNHEKMESALLVGSEPWVFVMPHPMLTLAASSAALSPGWFELPTPKRYDEQVKEAPQCAGFPC